MADRQRPRVHAPSHNAETKRVVFDTVLGSVGSYIEGLSPHSGRPKAHWKNRGDRGVTIGYTTLPGHTTSSSNMSLVLGFSSRQ